MDTGIIKKRNTLTRKIILVIIDIMLPLIFSSVYVNFIMTINQEY